LNFDRKSARAKVWAMLDPHRGGIYMLEHRLGTLAQIGSWLEFEHIVRATFGTLDDLERHQIEVSLAIPL
jgi:hypothetical protein